MIKMLNYITWYGIEKQSITWNYDFQTILYTEHTIMHLYMELNGNIIIRQHFTITFTFSFNSVVSLSILDLISDINELFIYRNQYYNLKWS